jgi:hypothetical protein
MAFVSFLRLIRRAGLNGETQGLATEHMKGCIDVCTQTTISGWTTAPWLEVYVNGEMACKVESGGQRSDLIAAGIREGRTFHGVFPRPLWLQDRVAVRLPDNSSLTPSETASHIKRLRQVLSNIDLSRPGLEFGPLNRPIVPRQHAEVYYVDHDDQAGLKRKYAASLGVETDKIPTIDFVWSNGQVLPDVVGKKKFGWVIASHVGEHIADFIGWLDQLADVLDDGGCVSLVLPHSERTFDARRRLSTFGDLVAAHIMRLSRPNPYQVLGHMLGVSEYWGIDLKRPENLAELINAINVAKEANSGAYIDIHCHVFTPASFSECYSTIEQCGLVKLRLSSVVETERDEFMVRLIK